MAVTKTFCRGGGGGTPFQSYSCTAPNCSNSPHDNSCLSWDKNHHILEGNYTDLAFFLSNSLPVWSEERGSLGVNEEQWLVDEVDALGTQVLKQESVNQRMKAKPKVFILGQHTRPVPWWRTPTPLGRTRRSPRRSSSLASPSKSSPTP